MGGASPRTTLHDLVDRIVPVPFRPSPLREMRGEPNLSIPSIGGIPWGLSEVTRGQAHRGDLSFPSSPCGGGEARVAPWSVQQLDPKQARVDADGRFLVDHHDVLSTGARLVLLRCGRYHLA